MIISLTLSFVFVHVCLITNDIDSLTDRSEFLKPMTINNIEPASMSAIRSLSSRIDSLVDHTNRIANDFEYSSKELFPIQYDNHQRLPTDIEVETSIISIGFSFFIESQW